MRYAVMAIARLPAHTARTLNDQIECECYFNVLESRLFGAFLNTIARSCGTSISIKNNYIFERFLETESEEAGMAGSARENMAYLCSICRACDALQYTNNLLLRLERKPSMVANANTRARVPPCPAHHS